MQFFLSSRGVYILAWNTRLGYEHAGLDFWLSSIACHCPGVPVFVVGTHADEVKPSAAAASGIVFRVRGLLLC
jgi:leucine-rich repeat kinase 2